MTFVEVEVQSLQATEETVRRPRDRVRVTKFDVGKTAQKGSERNPSLETGQRRAGAEVRTGSEGQMRVIAAGNIQTIRIYKSGRVAVGGAQNRLHQLAMLVFVVVAVLKFRCMKTLASGRILHHKFWRPR